MDTFRIPQILSHAGGNRTRIQILSGVTVSADGKEFFVKVTSNGKISNLKLSQHQFNRLILSNPKNFDSLKGKVLTVTSEPHPNGGLTYTFTEVKSKASK